MYFIQIDLLVFRNTWYLLVVYCIHNSYKATEAAQNWCFFNVKSIYEYYFWKDKNKLQ